MNQCRNRVTKKVNRPSELSHKLTWVDYADELEKEIKEMKEKIEELEPKHSDCCNALIDTDEQSLYICSNCGDRI